MHKTRSRSKYLPEEIRRESKVWLAQNAPLINLGEILYTTERRGGVTKAQDTLALLRQLPIDILPADEQFGFSAAHIKASYTLSYADALNASVLLRSASSNPVGAAKVDKKTNHIGWFF